MPGYFVKRANGNIVLRVARGNWDKIDEEELRQGASCLCPDENPTMFQIQEINRKEFSDYTKKYPFEVDKTMIAGQPNLEVIKR